MELPPGSWEYIFQQMHKRRNPTGWRQDMYGGRHMPDIERMPIYLVITEQVNIYPWSMNYMLKFIKRVIQCDLADMQDIYATIINPMYNEGQRISVEMYLREPPSPFQNWKEIELAQIKESQERDRQDRLDYLERTAKQDEKPGALPGD